MDPNIEYEKFAQEVYQGLINTDGITTIDVQHNVKHTGKSGQAHQIDVYWEYEYAGVKHKVAIECKNYKSEVPIGKVRDFWGVLSDLNNVAGIMVTKIGYQKGAKKFADSCGIELKELRTPSRGESIIGELEITIDSAVRSCLFLMDEEWAKSNNLSLDRYRKSFDSMSSTTCSTATHIPLPRTPGAQISDEKGQIIATFDELERKLPEDSFETGSDHVFNFENAYVNTIWWGPIKIKEVKYAHRKDQQKTVISLDAQSFTKAILKDAISGKIRLIAK